MGRFEEFTQGYVTALIWQDGDDDVSAMHAEGFDVFDSPSVAAIKAECDDFLTDEVRRWIESMVAFPGIGYSWAQAGHDFALTRNGHGAGFWDRGLDVIGDRLTDAAHVYGETNVWIGNNGRLVYDA